MTARHRTLTRARWPLVLAWIVAPLAALLTVTGTAAEADRPPREPAQVTAPVTSSTTCVPATTSYPDGSVWHRCADVPPPTVLPAEDPFTRP